MHELPTDLREALFLDPQAQEKWQSLTLLAKNEWICWIISAKKEKTREARIARAVTELKQGARRPCCWIGCIHRQDKKISPSVQAILDRQNGTRKTKQTKL